MSSPSVSFLQIQANMHICVCVCVCDIPTPHTVSCTEHVHYCRCRRVCDTAVGQTPTCASFDQFCQIALCRGQSFHWYFMKISPQPCWKCVAQLLEFCQSGGLRGKIHCIRLNQVKLQCVSISNIWFSKLLGLFPFGLQGSVVQSVH